MSNLRKIRSKAIKPKQYRVSENDIENTFNFLFGGMMDAQGRIVRGMNNRRIVYGNASDLSPVYRKFVADMSGYARNWPVNDPRMWVPLVRAGVTEGTLGAQSAMEADYDLMAIDGETATPYGVPRTTHRPSTLNLTGQTTSLDLPTDTGEPAFTSTPQAPTEDAPGFMDRIANAFGDTIETMGNIGENIFDTAETVTEPVLENYVAEGQNLAEVADTAGVDDVVDASAGYYSTLYDQTGADEVTEHVLKPVGGWAVDKAADIGTSGPIKAVSRNTFAALNMSYQAMVGTGANVANDISEGDYKSAILHAYGAFPLFEAAFIAAENATGTQFYREDGTEPTNWSQTDMGQVLLDVAGQGKGENLGEGDDKAGFSDIDQGSGFFISPDSEIGQQQEAARLAAGPIVEEQPITDQDLKHISAIANAQGEEEALAYAQAQGWEWKPESHEFVTPAQGWTFGRQAAELFYDPGTSAYNNFSGVVDFNSAIFLDPVNWIPGAGIKTLVTSAKGGGKIIRGVEAEVGLFDAQGRQLLTPNEFAEVKDTEAVANALAEGATVASEKGWEWLRSVKGQERVRGIADEKYSYNILRKSGNRFDADTASQLARASTPEEVMRVLAPRIGVDVTYSNDLARFAPKMPDMSVGTRFAKLTDIDTLKTSLVKHLPGMNFMPGVDIDVDDIRRSVEQLRRWGGIAFRKIDDDEGFVAAMSRYIDADTANGGGRASRGVKYQALYGTKGDHLVVDANGNAIMTAEEFKHVLRKNLTKEQMDQELQFGLSHGLTDGELEAKLAKNGHRIETQGHDGVFAHMMNKMVDEAGLDPALAHKLTRAWRQDDEVMRHYAEDGMGGDYLLPWHDTARAEPFLEVDVLGRTAALPDIAAVRQHLSRSGHIVDSLMASSDPAIANTGEIARALDDWTTMAVYRWKQLTLLGVGLRYPAYAMRQTLDTQITAALSGGASLLRRPRDYVGLLMTSAIRQAADGPEGLNHLNAVIARSLNPLYKMLFRPNVIIRDARGQKFEDGLVRVKNGDPDGMDDMWMSLNAHAGSRGSLGQDVVYNFQADGMRPVDRTNPAHRTMYTEAIATELHKLASSPIARRVVDPEKTMADNIGWFIKSTDDSGRRVIATFGEDAARSLDTPEGVRAYLDRATEYVKMVTGNDPDLLAAIRSGRFAGERIFVKHPSNTSRGVNKTLAKKIDQMMDDPDTTLPQRWHHAPDFGVGPKSGWDQWMRLMFHSSGQWEDTYARDPFYRERYAAHVEDLMHMMDPTQRAAMAKEWRADGSIKIAKRAEKVDTRGAMTRSEVSDIAHYRASQDIFDIAYDAANRREWAYAMRLLTPFAQAAVNGMYRWTRAAVQNPESTYRLQRAGNFLTSQDSASVADFVNGTGTNAPFVFEDQYGQRRFSVPLVGRIAEGLGVPDDISQLASISAGSLNLGFPQYEQVEQEAAQSVTGSNGLLDTVKVLWPGAGPALTIPAAFLLDDADGFLSDLLTPYGRGEGSGTDRLTDMLAPNITQKLWNVLYPGPDDQAKMAKDVALYASLLMKDENTDLLDQDAVNSAWERARSMVRTMRVVEAFANIATPSSLRLEDMYKDPHDVPDHLIFADQLGQLLYDNYLPANDGDYDQAQAEMMADWGIGSLLWATPSGPNSDAAPPTKNVAALKSAFPDAYDEYKSVLDTLLPKDGFDFDIYNAQLRSGERERMTIDQRRDASMQALYTYVYNYRLGLIDDATATDWQKTAEKNALSTTLVDAGWEGPTYTSRTRQQRDLAANLMLDATRDPDMVEFIGDQTSDLLSRYLVARKQQIKALQREGSSGTSGDLASSTVAGKSMRFQLFSTGEAFAMNDPGFAHIWWNGLRSEVAPEIEEGP